MLVITNLSWNPCYNESLVKYPLYNGSRNNLIKHLVKKANSTLVKKRQQIQATDSQGKNVSLNPR